MELFLLVLLVLGIGVITAILKSPKFIGRQGERFVNNKFLSELDPLNYTLLNDILLHNGSDIGTTQIDQVIVSNFGIFCIETKAYAGWIFGRESDKYWTQSVNYRKYRFFNPLRQNYGHVKTLEQLLAHLNISIPIYSFVAFPDAEELKITGTDAVGYARDIVCKIKKYNQVILSNEDKDKIINVINQSNILDEKIRQEHSQKVADMRYTPQIRQKKRYRQKYEDSDNYYDDNFDDDDDFDEDEDDDF